MEAGPLWIQVLTLVLLVVRWLRTDRELSRLWELVLAHEQDLLKTTQEGLTWMSTKQGPTSASNAATSGGLAARLASLKDSGKQQRATWSSAPAELMLEVISDLVEEGCLVSFSRTSDGGALVFAIMSDGERQRFYASSEQELDVLLEAVANIIKHST